MVIEPCFISRTKKPDSYSKKYFSLFTVSARLWSLYDQYAPICSVRIFLFFIDIVMILPHRGHFISIIPLVSGDRSNSRRFLHTGQATCIASSIITPLSPPCLHINITFHFNKRNNRWTYFQRSRFKTHYVFQIFR